MLRVIPTISRVDDASFPLTLALPRGEGTTLPASMIIPVAGLVIAALNRQASTAGDSFSPRENDSKRRGAPTCLDNEKTVPPHQPPVSMCSGYNAQGILWQIGSAGIGFFPSKTESGTARFL